MATKRKRKRDDAGEDPPTKRRKHPQCDAKNCTNIALKGGKCTKHGGGRRCSAANCTRGAKQGGKCISHGGGVRCRVAGCQNSTAGGTKCISHGGGVRCDIAGCTKPAAKEGKCRKHHNHSKINPRVAELAVAHAPVVHVRAPVAFVGGPAASVMGLADVYDIGHDDKGQSGGDDAVADVPDLAYAPDDHTHDL